MVGLHGTRIEDGDRWRRPRRGPRPWTSSSSRRRKCSSGNRRLSTADHAPDPGHAAVPPDEGGAPGRPALLPHGRLLRAVLRGRGGGGAALEIALTSRSKDRDGTPIPMCGVPHHAVTGYVARLVKQGFRVALCEQMEDPRAAKGVVSREVVRVVTPGTQLEASALEPGETAFVLALAPGRRRRSARPGSTPPPASSSVAEWAGPGAGSGCATSSRPRARARCWCRAARRCRRWLATPRSPRRPSRAPSSTTAPSTRAARGASCSPTSACSRWRPSAARRCRWPRRPAGPPCATCATPRSGTSTHVTGLRTRDVRGRPGHRRAHAPQPGAGREPRRRQRAGARCSTCWT